MRKKAISLLAGLAILFTTRPIATFASDISNVKIPNSNIATTINSNLEEKQSVSKSLLIGRFDTSDPQGPKFAWSNSTIKANFKGTGISANLKSTGDDWFNVIVDGEVKAPINVNVTTESPITLASGLSQGKHSIELVKRTEPMVGQAQFLGFTVTGGKLLDAPKPSSKHIMFVGDSITCGYGDEGADQYQPFTAKNENAYLSYGAITARNLGADLMNISYSGKGIYKNYDKSTTDTMPELYDRVLLDNSSNLWDAEKWTPQIVVINLGTNDFEAGDGVDKTTFISTYTTFVDHIRKDYPKADIYCAIGPGLIGDELISQREYVTSIVDSKKSSGDKKICFIEFPTQDPANGYGEDWHPSLKTHALMANQLAAQIKSDLNW